jgi:hypothetical protein
MSSVGELEEEYFDVEDVPSTPLRIPSNQKNSNRSAHQHRRSPSSLSHVHSDSPTTSLFSEQSDQNQRPPSLTESFIQLNYSSSMDSNQGIEIAGQNASKIPIGDKEVKDENEREGHSHQFNHLRLLKTGEPLLVPETQVYKLKPLKI